MRSLLLLTVSAFGSPALAAEGNNQEPEAPNASGPGRSTAQAQVRVLKAYSTKAAREKSGGAQILPKVRDVTCRDSDANAAAAPCVMKFVDLE